MATDPRYEGWKTLFKDEVYAVGLMKDGTLVGIRDADAYRGVPFTGLIVSAKHRAWFKDNEDVLRASFGANPDRKGQIIIFADETSVLEVF